MVRWSGRGNMRKSYEEIRQMAKDRVAEINAGKNPKWTPISRDEAMVYVAAFINGYDQAMEEVKASKAKAKP